MCFSHIFENNLVSEEGDTAAVSLQTSRGESLPLVKVMGQDLGSQSMKERARRLIHVVWGF